MFTKISSYILVGSVGVAVIAFLLMSVHLLYMDWSGMATWEMQERMEMYVPFLASPFAGGLAILLVGGIVGKIKAG